MKQDKLKGMEQRGQAYWYQDGIWELIVGMLFVLYAGYYALVGSISEDQALHTVLTVGYIVVIPGGMLLGSWIAKRLKSRVSAPRTGYVTFGRSRGHKTQAVALGAVIAGGAVAGALLSDEIYVPVLIGGMGMAFGAGVTGFRLGVVRLAIVGAVALAGSVAIGLATTEPETAFSLFFGVAGVALAVSGIVTLIGYLNANPLPDDEEDEA
jgi:hypothetical protein